MINEPYKNKDKADPTQHPPWSSIAFWLKNVSKTVLKWLLSDDKGDRLDSINIYEFRQKFFNRNKGDRGPSQLMNKYSMSYDMLNRSKR